MKKKVLINGIFILLFFSLLSCNNVVNDPNIQKNKEILQNPYNVIGQLHNEGLDFFTKTY